MLSEKICTEEEEGQLWITNSLLLQGFESTSSLVQLVQHQNVAGRSSLYRCIRIVNHGKIFNSVTYTVNPCPCQGSRIDSACSPIHTSMLPDPQPWLIKMKQRSWVRMLTFCSQKMFWGSLPHFDSSGDNNPSTESRREPFKQTSCQGDALCFGREGCHMHP